VLDPFLAAAKNDAYYAALARPHDASVVARVYELNDDTFRGEVKVLDGQVDAKAGESVERSSNPTLLDDLNLFDGPSMNLYVQILYRVYVPALGVEAESEAFTGLVSRPPSHADQDAVTLELQDMWAVTMRGRPAKQYKQKRTVDAMTAILNDCGFANAKLKGFVDPKNRQLEDPVNISDNDDTLLPGTQLRDLADSLDKQVYAAMDGTIVLRDYPGDDSALDITDLVTAQGQVDPPESVINRVKVIGKHGKQHGHPFSHTAVVTLPASHPLSPQSLKVGGALQYFTQTEENDHFDTDAKAQARADRLLKKAKRDLEQTAVYNCVPFPNLDLNDVVQIGANTHTVSSYSFPLTTSGDMTLGYAVPL
jgi:hypothetical protein